MKFLVDESVEFPVVTFLRDNKFDVIAISEARAGLEDARVLATAAAENRILITNDKDFGELIFKHNLPHKGIILIRAGEDARTKITILKSLLSKYAKRLPGKFTVTTDKKVRFV